MKIFCSICAYIVPLIPLLTPCPASAGAEIPFTGIQASTSRDQARADWEWRRLRDPATNAIPPGIRERELWFARKSGALKPSLNSPGWIRRGPFNIGGRTRALAVDVSNEQTLLAGGVSGGMWRSADQGATWNRVTGPREVQTVSCIAQDTRSGKTGVWYYGTGEIIGNSTRDQGGNAPVRGNGIYKSTDSGRTWTALASTVVPDPEKFTSSFQYVNTIATDPSNTTEDEVYAACTGAIFRSTDGGATWKRTLGTGNPSGAGVAPYTDVAVASTGMVYATLSTGTGMGIWRSPDGLKWENISPGGWPGSGFVRIGIAPTNESTVYFFGHIPGYGINNGVLLLWSNNAWSDLSQNLPYSTGTDNLDLQGGYNMVIAVSPWDENVVFLGDVNLWRSTDGFSSSDNLTQIGGYSTDNSGYIYPNHHPDLHAVAFLPSNPRVLFSGSDGGVSVTGDCTASNVQWTYLNNGLYTTQFYCAAIDHATTSPLIMGGMQDWGTFGTLSTEYSDPWSWYIPGDGGLCHVRNSGNAFYGAAENGYIFSGSMGPDGGLSDWALLTPSGGKNFLFVTPYVMDPNDNKVIYVGAGNVIWRNSDVSGIPSRNVNPTNINYFNMSKAAPSTGNISAFGISTQPANVLYYGTDRGEVYRVDKAESGNPGHTDIWTGKGFPRDSYVNCIAVDPGNADHVIVIFSNYEVKSVFYTANAGKTWASISGNLEENADGSGSGPSVRWATHLHASGGDSMYFVGTSTGLYSTRGLRGDQTIWSQESPDLIGNMVVDGVDSRSTDNLVVAATHGGGVFSAHAIPVGVNEEKPVAFELKQNAPNPFNSGTVIEFTLPVSSHAVLTVYDILGRKVKTLVNENRAAGTHKIIWDGCDSRGGPMAGGVYFYRLETAGSSLARRMVYLK